MQNILITAKSTIASVGHEKEQIWSNYPESVLKKVIGRKSLYKSIDDHILKYTAKKIVMSIYTFNFSAFYKSKNLN